MSGFISELKRRNVIRINAFEGAPLGAADLAIFIAPKGAPSTGIFS
jgi:hypothetical protein